MTTLPLSILEGMLNDIKLDEITYESIAMEMEKDEKEGKQGKEPVPSDERVEAVQEADNRGKGSDLPGHQPRLPHGYPFHRGSGMAGSLR